MNSTVSYDSKADFLGDNYKYSAYIDVPEQKEEAPRFTPEQVMKFKKVGLAKFLTYRPGREAFRRFTVLEFSVENLMFIEAVHRFREIEKPTRENIDKILDNFIGTTAPNQVNVPSGVVERLTANLVGIEEKDIKTVFHEAYLHVMKLMSRDTYKRFQQTRDWETHVVVFDSEITDSPPTPRAATKTAPASTDPPRSTGVPSEQSSVPSEQASCEPSSTNGGPSGDVFDLNNQHLGVAAQFGTPSHSRVSSAYTDGAPKDVTQPHGGETSTAAATSQQPPRLENSVELMRVENPDVVMRVENSLSQPVSCARPSGEVKEQLNEQSSPVSSGVT